MLLTWTTIWRLNLFELTNAIFVHPKLKLRYDNNSFSPNWIDRWATSSWAQDGQDHATTTQCSRHSDLVDRWSPDELSKASFVTATQQTVAGLSCRPNQGPANPSSCPLAKRSLWALFWASSEKGSFGGQRRQRHAIPPGTISIHPGTISIPPGTISIPPGTISIPPVP